MSFPSPTLPAPALSIGQMQYGGLTFGGIQQGTIYNLVRVEGLDPPDVISGDQARAQDEGEFAGLDVLNGRDFTIVQNISAGATGAKPTTGQLAALAQYRMELAGVLGVKGTIEEPLYVQTEIGTFACMARPRRHHFPWDVNAFVAAGVQATSMLHATDPRWYAVPTKTASVGIPLAAKGITFPLTFPITFPASSVGGLLVVSNNGQFEMRPLLIVTGPCINPKLTNLSLAGNPFLKVEIALNTGDMLAIDLDFQSIQYTAAGTSASASRRNALAPGSTWWNLPRLSENTISFNSDDTGAVAGTLTVQSADAYVGL